MGAKNVFNLNLYVWGCQNNKVQSQGLTTSRKFVLWRALWTNLQHLILLHRSSLWVHTVSHRNLWPFLAVHFWAQGHQSPTYQTALWDWAELKCYKEQNKVILSFKLYLYTHKPTKKNDQKIMSSDVFMHNWALKSNMCHFYSIFI